MEKFLLIIRIIGGLTLLASLICLFIGANEYATNLITIALFLFLIIGGIRLSFLYHNYFTNRRRS